MPLARYALYTQAMEIFINPPETQATPAWPHFVILPRRAAAG